MLKRIATAVVLIPIVVLMVLHAPVPVLAVVTAIVAVLTASEFLKLTEHYNVVPYYKASYVAIIVPFVLLALDGGQEKPLLSTGIFLYSAAFLACLVPFAFLTFACRRQDLSSGFSCNCGSNLPARYTSFTYCWWFGRGTFLPTL